MAGKSSNLGQFWKELKRRRVVRVITVYAAATFVILELVSIIEEPLQLPDWTLELVIVLLCIGFIITVIFSWIYDITPEGIEKTKPVEEIKEKVPGKPSGFNAWKIATFISVVVIVGLIIFHTVGERKQSSDISKLEKSIAVLPFKSLSDDPDKQYLADGAMDAILLHLSKIEDLRVMARTSVEQYRETDKTATTICQELDVAYLLEGSFQKYGDQARLIVQLIRPEIEGHIWANEYDRNWKDIFSVQSEVAQTIARELQAVITPEEKQLIEKTPTTSLTAYDFYQRGMEQLNHYWFEDDSSALNEAENLFYLALEYDSTFAQAYTGLAVVYIYKHYWETYFSENFLDSVLILTDIALSFDDKLAEAFTIRGWYYENKGLTEQAVKEYDKAIKFNPNEWRAYRSRGRLYENDDLVESINNYHIALSLNRGPELPYILRLLGEAYLDAGFLEKFKYYWQEAQKLDFDSLLYYFMLSTSEVGNTEKRFEFLKKGYAIDSNDFMMLHHLGGHYMFLGQYEQALKYYKKNYEILKASGRPAGQLQLGIIGYLYWQIGYKEEAEYYFNEEINYCSKMIELGRGGWAPAFSHYTLASVYAFRGEKDKAYENLRIFNQRQMMPFWIPISIKDFPLFDSIRDEPEFQQIARDLEAKFQAEHERVGKWLEENDML